MRQKLNINMVLTNTGLFCVTLGKNQKKTPEYINGVIKVSLSVALIYSGTKNSKPRGRNTWCARVLF